jgi:diaminopimelate decarboxylase
MMSERVEEYARRLAADGSRLPAYVYDLPELRAHVEAVGAALRESGAELFYAAKANPAPELLRVLGPRVAGIEVASGGELAHVRGVLPDARIVFGGPGKTDEELRAALRLAVDRVHVESPHEMARLIEAVELVEPVELSAGEPVGVLLRANLDLTVPGAVLSMSGPFGMDEAGLRESLARAEGSAGVRVRGVHTHLASGLDAQAMLALADQIIGWARPWLRTHLPAERRPDIVLGGGMGVDYARPDDRFDWVGYGEGLAARARRLEGSAVLRVEPGRALTVYSGYYVTDVLDVKWTRGQAFAVVRGGTHHLRTPAAKGHGQPYRVVPRGGHGPSLTSGSAVLVGQLCTPKDVLAQGPVEDLRVGDLVVFSMAGAYAWNISHHDFLMHPEPTFHYLDDHPDELVPRCVRPGPGADRAGGR